MNYRYAVSDAVISAKDFELVPECFKGEFSETDVAPTHTVVNAHPGDSSIQMSPTFGLRPL